MKGFNPYPKKGQINKLKVGKTPTKRNKYRAVKQTYNGYSYHSIKEAEYAAILDWRIKGKDVKSWTRQHKLELRVNGALICKYYIDFRAVLTDGTIEYIEVKGFETDLWRLKWKLTAALWAELTKGEKAKLVLIK